MLHIKKYRFNQIKLNLRHPLLKYVLYVSTSLVKILLHSIAIISSVPSSAQKDGGNLTITVHIVEKKFSILTREMGIECKKKMCHKMSQKKMKIIFQGVICVGVILRKIRNGRFVSTAEMLSYTKIVKCSNRNIGNADSVHSGWMKKEKTSIQ